MSEAASLLKLQEVDLDQLRDAKALKGLPQQKKLQTIELAKKKIQSELTRIVGQRKDAELALEDLDADYAHYLDVKEQVTAEAAEGEHTHREIRSYDLSLSSLAKRIEKCEYERPTYQANLDKLVLAEKNAHLTLDKLEEEKDATQKSYDEQSAELRASITERARERERLAADVAPEHLSAYETARKRFGGLAVETLTMNVPSVCRVKLQPSLYHDLSRGPQITECPYCHRILICEDEESL